MKKFFTLCAALFATAAVFAQEETTFSFVRDGQVVPNGSIVAVKEPEVEIIDLSAYGMGVMYKAQYNSGLSLKNNTSSTAVVIATIEELVAANSDMPYVGICAGGTCENLTDTRKSATKTVEVAAGATLNLQVEAIGTTTSVESEYLNFVNNYNSSTRVSLQLQGDPGDITTITLNMGKTITAGLANVNATNKVALSGRTLNYKFAGNANRTLRIYNVSGAAVMSQKLTGAAGTVSLNNLPAGIYIYQVNGASGVCGKVVLK